MPQSTTLNRRIVLNARPHGAPTAADLHLESDPVPVPEAGPDRLGLLRGKNFGKLVIQVAHE